MDRDRIIIYAVTLCALVLFISICTVYIPQTKAKENLSSFIYNIATTESTAVDITTSKYYTHDQSTAVSTSKSSSIADSASQPSATNSQAKTVTTAPIDTVTTTGKAQIVISNKIETSTDDQISYWSLDASLNQGRSNFGSVLLMNGRIMTAGGRLNLIYAVLECESYSSSSGWEITTSINTYRYFFTLTAFANNTKALATGTAHQISQKTAEVFDSTTNTWTYTSGNMSSNRFHHTATLLGNGQILILGGRNASYIAISSADIYIPSSNSFINTSNMIIGRCSHVSTLLSNGSTVLVTGGLDSTNSILSIAELYIGGSWTIPNDIMSQVRVFHAAVLLNDGNVLIVGGGNGGSVSFETAEIYNAITRTFTAVGSMKYRRAVFTLTLLPSGKVLAAGGIDWNTYTYPKVCELYDPLTRTWSDTNMLNYGRMDHQTILLNDSVIIIGGSNDSASTGVAISEKFYL